jgi:hypothetical protein
MTTGGRTIQPDTDLSSAEQGFDTVLRQKTGNFPHPPANSRQKTVTRQR